ncbi:MAG: hypothetical protein LUE31_11005 [Lachnospiraceae bacterium]|nr:hypothetical protein [Lachnospiraceae bacterium]
MTMEERDRQIWEDRVEEGKLQVLVEQICDAAADFAPDYDTLEILDMLLEEEE